MNGRNAMMEEVAQRYVVKHPGKIRLMGDGSNRGIARAMVAMTQAAKGPYFLFMERDFQVRRGGETELREEIWQERYRRETRASVSVSTPAISPPLPSSLLVASPPLSLSSRRPVSRSSWRRASNYCRLAQVRAHPPRLRACHSASLTVSPPADVVRYRHRKKAGRPNWAERFFKGHEEDAFYGRQPNLACNHQ